MKAQSVDSQSDAEEAITAARTSAVGVVKKPRDINALPLAATRV